jgi:hypothetical protein
VGFQLLFSVFSCHDAKIKNAGNSSALQHLPGTKRLQQACAFPGGVIGCTTYKSTDCEATLYGIVRKEGDTFSVGTLFERTGQAFKRKEEHGYAYDGKGEICFHEKKHLPSA